MVPLVPNKIDPHSHVGLSSKRAMPKSMRSFPQNGNRLEFALIYGPWQMEMVRTSGMEGVVSSKILYLSWVDLP